MVVDDGETNQVAAGVSFARNGFAISSVPSVGATSITAVPLQTWHNQECVRMENIQLIMFRLQRKKIKFINHRSSGSAVAPQILTNLAYRKT